MPHLRKDLTIVTVAGPGDEHYVRHNIELIRSLNPGVSMEIVVIDNGKTGDSGEGIAGPLDAILVDGEPHQANIPSSCKGSYQHAAAMTRFARDYALSSRYLLVLDPDFYIVAPGWIDAVIKHMQAEKIGIFGAPWHPQWYNKYRYFPCVHCMFIDLDQVDARTLDFTPDLIDAAEERQREKEKAAAAPKHKVKAGVIPLGDFSWYSIYLEMKRLSLATLNEAYLHNRRRRPMALRAVTFANQLAYVLYRVVAGVHDRVRRKGRRLIRFAKTFWPNRSMIASSNDTGYLIYRQYGASPRVRSGTLQPVFDAQVNRFKLTAAEFRLLRLIERVMPDAKSYFPKRRDYATPLGFAAHGLPDTTAYGWEEFMFQGRPFGFHLRRYNKGYLKVSEELDVLEQVLAKTGAANRQPAGEPKVVAFEASAGALRYTA